MEYLADLSGPEVARFGVAMVVCCSAAKATRFVAEKFGVR